MTGPPVPVQRVQIRGDVFTSWHLREVSVFADPLTQVLPTAPAAQDVPARTSVPTVPALPQPPLPARLVPQVLPSLAPLGAGR